MEPKEALVGDAALPVPLLPLEVENRVVQLDPSERVNREIHERGAELIRSHSKRGMTRL
jgi:hypothetical protein